VASAIHKPS
jgi:mitogen-activated protein kinase 1/3